MAKGYGIEVGDWVLIGAIGILGYFAYKTFIKPVSDVTTGAANIITGAENAVGNAGSIIAGAAKSALNAITGQGGYSGPSSPASAANNPGVYAQDPNQSLSIYDYSIAGSGLPLNQVNQSSPQKTMNVKTPSTGKVISESVDLGGGLVQVSTGKSYQVNMGSGTGSSNTSPSKTLSPQKGVTNIKTNLQTAQNTHQAINLIGLGKGATINLDTGNVSYK